MRSLRIALFVFAGGALASTASLAADSKAGRKAWLSLNCYGCHGASAGGGMGPNIRHKELGDVSQAMNGDAKEGGMRSYKGIASATDPANIAAYLATIGTTAEPTWVDWWNH